MFQKVFSEPSFVSSDTQWYGTRYFFKKKNWIQKECLEVIFYPDLSSFSYRYILWKGLFLSSKEGTISTQTNDELPFWIRKIFYQFLRDYK